MEYDDQKVKFIRKQVPISFIDKNEDGKAFSMIAQQELAGYKSKAWDYEQEVRYIIMTLPGFETNKKNDFDIQQAYKNAVDSDKLFFDISLDEEKLNNITITLGPHSSPGAKVIVEALLKSYAKNGNLKESELTSIIRPK